MKQIKTVIFDMDGTALNDAKQMDALLIQYRKEIKAADVRLIVASGRLEHMVYNYMDELEIDTPIIGCNGATITYRNQKTPLFAARLPQNELHQIIAKIEELGEIFHIFTLQGLVGLEKVGRLAYYSDTNESKTIEQQVPIFIGSEYLNTEFLKDAVKLLLVTDNLEHFESIRAYAQKLGLDAVQSGDNLLDIMAKGVNKGAAITELSNRGIIDLETTLVFGDNFNDIEMLQAAKYPIVMENAEAAIKKHAFAICPTNEKSGVGQYVLNALGIPFKEQ